MDQAAQELVVIDVLGVTGVGGDQDAVLGGVANLAALESDVVGVEGHFGLVGDLDPVYAGNAEPRSIHHEVFQNHIALEIEVDYGIAGGRSRLDDGGLAGIRGHGNGSRPRSAAGDRVIERLRVGSASNIERVTRLEKTYAMVDGGERLGKCAEILIRTGQRDIIGRTRGHSANANSRFGSGNESIDSIGGSNGLCTYRVKRCAEGVHAGVSGREGVIGRQ